MIISAPESDRLNNAVTALNAMCKLFATCDSCPLNKTAGCCEGECPVDMLTDAVEDAEVSVTDKTKSEVLELLNDVDKALGKIRDDVDVFTRKKLSMQIIAIELAICYIEEDKGSEVSE